MLFRFIKKKLFKAAFIKKFDDIKVTCNFSVMINRVKKE